MKPQLVALTLLFALAPVYAAELPKVAKVELQPLAAQAERVAAALELLGAPLSEDDRKALKSAKDVSAIQAVLDPRCLAGVRIVVDGNAPELSASAGPAKPELAEQGWRVFLVKVLNPGGRDRLELQPSSVNALPLTQRSSGKPDPKVNSVGQVDKRFLDVMSYTGQPLLRDLSGLEVEYRVLQLFSRDAGRKEATLVFSLVGDTKKTVATSAPLPVLFESIPAVVVRLRMRDHDGAAQRDGRPIMAAFTFTDSQGRSYPAQSRRLAPDFNFHPQVYRADGESVLLQPGKYAVSYTRGPEYHVLRKEITVPPSATYTAEFPLKRWVHLASKGWWSGDHHIHAAGCSHYESPTEGVTPEDMMRHLLGEDLNVGCCLSWGPCWYHQKRYFEGRVHPLSTPNNLLRYDVEVSGFPSSHAGHICLLRLREQDYPGTKLIADWPSWDLPIFRWAKAQGAVVGFAHSGWGLEPVEKNRPEAQQIPNYLLPAMSSIGANEYIVDITHDLTDFISLVDTPSVWELNIWYHTLNVGYRCRGSGETDFPCIYGDRVGLGRSYVHLDGKLDFDDWCEGIKKGRCYVGDGRSHLIDFTVNGLGVGQKGSEVKLDESGTIEIKAKVAALLEEKPTAATEAIRKKALNEKPYWDIERSRVGATRKVPVEVIVNGYPVDKKEIVADGSEQELTFAVPLKHSSWVALRVLPSSHTNPVFVLVGGKPIRASKRSAEWCLKAVEKCWDQKKKAIREKEQAEAVAAYDHARAAYRKLLEESVAESKSRVN